MLHHLRGNSCRKKNDQMVVTYWLNDRNFGVNNLKMIVIYNFSRGDRNCLTFYICTQLCEDIVRPTNILYMEEKYILKNDKTWTYNNNSKSPIPTRFSDQDLGIINYF